MSICEHLVDTPVGPLRWLETSGSRSAVALLHGNSSSAELWRPLLQGPLGQRYRLCALELPGHGRSNDRDPSCYTLEGLCAAVRAWMEAAGLHGSVCVGHSLGGHVWLQLGADLLNAQAGLFVFGTPPLRSLASFVEAFSDHPAVALLGKGELVDDEAEQWARALAHPGDLGRERLVQSLRETDGRFRETCLGSVPEQLTDEVAVLDALQRPVALVHGDGDAFVRLDYLRSLSPPCLWDSRVHVIEEGGHCPQLTATERFEALLGAFIDHVVDGEVETR